MYARDNSDAGGTVGSSPYGCCWLIIVIRSRNHTDPYITLDRDCNSNKSLCRSIMEEAEISFDGSTSSIRTPSDDEDIPRKNVQEAPFPPNNPPSVPYDDPPTILHDVIFPLVIIGVIYYILCSFCRCRRRLSNHHPHQSSSPLSISQRIARMSRECISCDSCGKSNPQKQCSICHTAYYCSTFCQTRHLPEHRPYCHSIDRMQQLMMPGMPDLTSNNTAYYNTECGICLTEMEQPLVLSDCKHAFCSACLMQWQKHLQRTALQEGSKPGTDSSCPLCRTNTAVDAEQAILDRAILLARRANRTSCKMSEEERQQYREEALAQLDQVLENSEHIQALCSKAQILLSLGKRRKPSDTLDRLIELDRERCAYAERFERLCQQADHAKAVGKTEEAMRLQAAAVKLAERSGIPGTRLAAGNDERFKYFDFEIAKAEGFEQLKEWDKALEIYFRWMQMPESDTELSPPQTRQLFMGFARCFYGKGEYDKAISASEAAIEMNRHFPGVHKYMALSFKAMGDIDKAIKTMTSRCALRDPVGRRQPKDSAAAVRRAPCCS